MEGSTSGFRCLPCEVHVLGLGVHHVEFRFHRFRVKVKSFTVWGPGLTIKVFAEWGSGLIIKVFAVWGSGVWMHVYMM